MCTDIKRTVIASTPRFRERNVFLQIHLYALIQPQIQNNSTWYRQCGMCSLLYTNSNYVVTNSQIIIWLQNQRNPTNNRELFNEVVDQQWCVHFQSAGARPGHSVYVLTQNLYRFPTAPVLTVQFTRTQKHHGRAQLSTNCKNCILVTLKFAMMSWAISTVMSTTGWFKCIFTGLTTNCPDITLNDSCNNLYNWTHSDVACCFLQ